MRERRARAHRQATPEVARRAWARRRALAAVVGAVAVVGGAVTVPAHAGEAPVAIDLTSQETSLGRFGMALQWVQSTGEVTGSLTFSPIVTETTTQPPLPVLDVVATTELTLVGDPNLTGTLDAATGEGQLSAQHRLRTTIVFAEGQPPIICESDPFTVTFTTDDPGAVPLAPLPFDEDGDYSITFRIGLPVPAYAADDCALNGTVLPTIAETVNESGGLPLLLEGPVPLVRGTPPPPPPPTTTTTAPPTTTTTAPPTDATITTGPPAAVAPAPVTAAPRFTG
jgi:hypothetical protein